MSDAERLAQIFHIQYEALAPLYDYATRPESRREWADVPEKNKQLMVAVCGQLLANNIVALRADLQNVELQSEA